MKKDLLTILCCPSCKGDLELKIEKEEKHNILEGLFTCTNCQNKYPITNSIPRFLTGKELQKTRKGFTEQWELRFTRQFEDPNISLWGQDIKKLIDWFFKTSFKGYTTGDWLLDAGCGSSEKTAYAAKTHPDLNVIGFDMMDKIDEISELYKDIPNLHFIQGDVTYPPFKKESIQNLLSQGVLHCTNNTYSAFSKNCDLVKKEGHMMVWIYPDPKEDLFFRIHYYPMRDLVFLKQGHRLSPKWRYHLLQFILLLNIPYLYFMIKFILIPKYRNADYMAFHKMSFWENFRSILCLMYDNLMPEFQHRHKQAEVLGWFSEKGFVNQTTDKYGFYWATKS